MPRKNIDAKDYRKVGIPYTLPYNTRSKDRTSAIRNESDISNTSTSSDSDSSSRILKRIFCETSSEDEFPGFTQEDIDESNRGLISMKEVAVSISQDNSQISYNQDSKVEILDAPGNHSGNEKNYVVKSQSTVGDGNCFFHAVFGTLCGGEYKTDKAQEMRKEWYEFLSQFESLSDKNNFMSESLRNQLTQVFQGFFSDYNSLTGGKEKFRNLIIKKLNKVQWSEDLIGKLSLIQKKELLEGSELYKIYCDCIKEQCYYIFDDEIHILASLANITIYVYDNIQYKDRPLVCKPIPKIVQEYKQKRSDLWGNKQQETIFHTGTNHFSRATLSVEQSSSLLKDVFNSPTRRRNPIISKSPGKENSPKKRKYSKREIIQSQEKNLMTQLSHIDSGVEFADENSILPEEPSELNLSKKNCETSGRSRKLEHPPTGENDRLPGSREKRKLDFAIDEANQQSNSSNKKVRKITHNLHFVQTSTPLKNDSGLGSSLLSSSEILKSHEGLKEFLKECEEGGKIAIYCDYAGKKLSKISLSCNEDEVHYIKKDFEQDALEEINGVLSSGKVKKVIVYDIKEVKKNLPGIEKILDSVDDLKVMSYSLDTKKHDNSLSSIVEHNFNRIEGAFSAGTLVEVHNKLEYRLFEQEKLRKIYDNYDKPLTEVILNMENKGIRVDRQKLCEVSDELNKKITTLEGEIYKLAGVKFKIGSPVKLQQVLFNKMKLLHKAKLNDLGYRGTGSKTLREFERRGVEIVGKILRWRSLNKLKSNVKEYIGKEDGSFHIIHTDFLTTKTKTGRITSTKPNLQDIPFRGEEAILIRQAFIAEEGHKLISADYSQMELRILAEIAKVKKLKEAFDKGEDIHAITAKQIFGREDGGFRQKAKAINFGIIYGMSEYQLAKELKVSTQEAKTYIEKYYKEYPEIKEYKRNTVVYGRAYGYVETLSGRRISTEYINSRIISVKEHYRRAAVNARIQGTAADIMRFAMTKLSKELKEKKLGELILTIHDELIVEAKDENVDEVKKLMQEVMEETVKDVLGAPISVKTKVGNDLSFGKKYQPMENVSSIKDQPMETDFREKGLMEEDESHEEEIGDLINYDLEEEEYCNSCFDILGIEYQVLVSMLCFHLAFNVHGKKYKNLSLATEEDQKKVGKYDDIVIHYIDKEDKKKAINVQVKRIDEEEGYNEIDCTTLFPQGEGKNKDMFAINKYFMSFLEQDKERRDETKYNVIFTNSDLATKDGKKVKYKLLKHSGIEVDEIRDEVLEDLLCANKEQPGFYNFSKGEVREKILKVIDPLQSESRKKVKRILEESTLSKVRIEKIEELLNSPSGKKEEIKKLIEEVKEQLKPLEKATKENVLVLLKPLFAAKEFTEEEYKKLIDDFFDKLVLAVNQPNRQELKMIVKKEIEEKIVKNNDSSKVFNDFEKKLFGWLEKRIENEGIRITKGNSGNYFREINKNADKGINTGTPREGERYKKTPWVGAMVPRIVYIWELLTFYIYKAFLANKNDKDYEELSIKIGEKRTGESNYTCFNYKDKCTCISFKYKDIREGRREEIFTSIDDRYDYFLKLRKERKNLEHFVVSVEGFELEKEHDFIGENELEGINFQEKGDHKFLENFFLCEGKGKESSFYRFSEETIRKFLDKTDEEHKNEKKAFLKILVFMVNLPGREKLESSIQSEIGREENYYNLKELALRWIESAKGMSINNKIKEKCLKDIKNGKVSKLTYEMAEENKGLIGPIDSFVRTIVARGEARRFRELKEFLCDKGVDKFKALISNQALHHVSGMLNTAKEDVVSAFDGLYDMLLSRAIKINGEETTYLKFLKAKGILSNISSMLSSAGSQAPEALKALHAMLSTKIEEGDGKGQTYLQFFVEKKIMGNISSMLNGAGKNAPEALKALHAMLSTKIEEGDGKGQTYLQFFLKKKIMVNISSMLSSAGSQAPEALETLITILTKERTINGEETTYLKFLEAKGILSNVSSMLNGAGKNAPEALKALHAMLSTKIEEGDGKGQTYLQFFLKKKIMGNISSMLSSAGSQAPEALKALHAMLSTKIEEGDGKGQTYLQFFVEKKIMGNISSMLNGAGKNAPEALKALHAMLSTKIEEGDGKGQTYLQFFVEKKIMGNISSMLSSAGSQAPEALKALHAMLSTKIEEGDGKGQTYLQFFVEKKIMGNISSMLSSAGSQAPEALKALHAMLSTKIEEGDGKGQTYLQFFVEKKIMGNISSMLSSAGSQAPEALKALHAMLSTKIEEGDGKGQTYLQFFLKKKIMVNISSMLHGAGKNAPEALKALHAMLSTKIEEGDGKGQTYLQFFLKKKIMVNISSMLSSAGSQAPEALKALHAMLSTKIEEGDGKGQTYLQFFLKKKIMGNISSMLSSAGSQAPEALKALHAMLSTKIEEGDGKGQTYLQFFLKKKIMVNISSMLHGAGKNAPEALKALHAMLSTKIEEGDGKGQTYLQFFLKKKIMVNISSMLHGAGKNAPEALKALHAMLSTKIEEGDGKGQTYLQFFVEKKIMVNISSMLSSAGSQAPEALKALHAMLSTKIEEGDGKGQTYLQFFVEKKIMGNISSMLSSAGSQAPEALKALHAMLSTKIEEGDGKGQTYLQFFVEKKIMVNISSMLHGAGKNAPEALKALHAMLSTKIEEGDGKGQTYLQFFVEKKIMVNISSMLSSAGSQAPEALKALHAMLSTKIEEGDGKGQTYLQFFVEKKIMGNISSMLNGAGKNAPEALKALHAMLSTKIEEGDGKGQTYLQFFVEKKIMGNISSMLSSAGSQAPEALKALHAMLSTKIEEGDGKGQTYLQFFVEKKIMGNISSMLSSAGSQAPEALKALHAMLSTKIEEGDGKGQTYLQFFVEKKIMGNISSMLSSAGSQAPEALKALHAMLSTKIEEGDGKGQTYLQFFVEKKIMGNISSMLSSAGSQAPEALKALHAMLSTKIEEGDGKGQTYLQFFVEKKIMGNISSMLSSAGSQAPEALKALHAMLSTKIEEGDGKGQTYLQFFVEKKIMGNISSMLSSAGSQAPEALKALHAMLSTKIEEGDGKGQTYLQFFVEKKIMVNISSMLHGAGKNAPEALKALHAMLSTKIEEGDGKGQTYLQFFVEKKIMVNISSMLHGAGKNAPEALKALHAMLSTKIEEGDGKGQTYLQFFVEKKIMVNISSMLSSAGSQAPEALKALHAMLSTKIEEGDGKGQTYLQFFVEKKIMVNISSMLHGAGKNAPEALKALHAMLSTKIEEGDGKGQTYLQFFVEKKIMVNISSMLHGAGKNAPEALKALHAMLSTKIEEGDGKGQTYLQFFVEKKIMVNISSMLSSAGSQAPEALKALHAMLSTKIEEGDGKGQTYLQFFLKKKIMGNISSMLHGARKNAPEALKALHAMLSTKIEEGDGKGQTYLQFFLKKKIMGNISSMLSSAGSQAPEALETLIKTLNEKKINGKTYLEFLKENNILSNVFSMLNGAGSKAPRVLEELLDALNLKIDGQQGKKTYLECFSEKGITNNEVIIDSLREWKKQRSEDYNKWFKNYFDKRLKNLTEKNVSSQENISPQQQGDKRKLKGSEESTTHNYSKKKKANTKLMSGCSDEERQEVVSCLSEFILNKLPDASVKSVRQGLHIPSFEKRGFNVNGKCIAITRSLSQALFLQNDKSLLNNLKTSSAIYERIVQGKQISKREEREVFAFSRLLNNFEGQLDSAMNSLPSSLIHTQGHKTFSNLSSYIAGIKGDFAIHLVTSNHVVAIYRAGDNYTYFDSNAAFVSGLKSVDQLMQIVEKGVESAGYKVEEKGFLVEHFDVERANKLLSSEDKQILAKEIKTERQLLAEQDKELGLIKVNGQELSRVQLYDFGTKINVEGSVPLLINADMNLSSKKFQDYLGKKEVSMTAREYLDSLRNSKNVEEVVQATKLIPFIGSNREIEEAEQTRKPLLEQLVKGTINSILAAISLTSASRSKSQLPGKAGNEPKTYLNDPTVDNQPLFQAISF